MSLIICKIIDDKIYIESDSRITDLNSGRKESIYGVIKTIILHPRISISYAGNIYSAEKAIKEIFDHNKITIDYLIETLSRHSNYSNNLDFILCLLTGTTNAEIIRIRNSSVERNLRTAWIGDISGFELFQRNYHSLIASNKNELESLRDAFSSVVDSGTISTVGDFQISTHTIYSTTGHRMFLYAEKFGVFSNEEQFINISGSDSPHKISFGSAQSGSYAVSYFVSIMPNHYAIGLYFTFGNYGVLFCPRIGFEGIMFTQVSNTEFLRLVNEKYKIPLRGFILHDDGRMQLADMRFPNKIN